MRQALTRNPQGKTWRGDTEAELQNSDHCWKELKETAQSRVSRLSVVGSLCSS